MRDIMLGGFIVLNNCLRMLSSLVVDANLRLYEPMSRHTTFRVGGPADALFTPRDENELVKAVRCCVETGTNLTVIGNGSNLLVSDAGLRGLVVRVCPETKNALSAVIAHGSRITCGAGATLSAMANAAQRAHLTGAEALSGIPGSLGGAAIMNAGAYESSMSDIVESVRVISRDGAGQIGGYVINIIEGSQLGFRYRGSSMMDNGDIITGVTVRLTEGDPKTITEKMNEYASRRRDKQPLTLPSAGSFFKRPQGYYAAKLIEEAGLKGERIGGAQVSQLHAGFIVNAGGATCGDILELATLVTKRVFDKFGVTLEREVRLIGEEG